LSSCGEAVRQVVAVAGFGEFSSTEPPNADDRDQTTVEQDAGCGCVVGRREGLALIQASVS
jgi:hypothetical protein